MFDAAACYPDVRVTLDGARVPSAAHEPYAGMYAGEPVLLTVPGYVVYVAEASERGLTVSFVNGVSTPDHGAHVARTLRRLHEAVAPDGDEAQWRRFVADKLFLLVFARLDRPAFRGNEKSSVGAPLRPEPAKLGRAQVKQLARFGAVWREWAVGSASAVLRRDERKRRGIAVDKLEDAVAAGTREWARCTLILTEGDSAKSFALAGLAVVGRKHYGVFPLRGKVKNVRDATATQADANTELRSLKTIIGLSTGALAQQPRYGRLMIMTDQDVDGFHIKGLVLNFLDSQFPGLIGSALQVECMRTPIVKATVRGTTHEFFSAPAFAAFASATNPPASGVKYYKGLGTSTSVEARAYFSDLHRYVVRYTPDPDGLDRLRKLFAKDAVAARKEAVLSALLLGQGGSVTGAEARDAEGFLTQRIGDLVDTELMMYSVDAVARCMPSVVDGLKPSQRKVLWCMLRGSHAEKKVAQLASYVAHDTAYHHGEASLQQTIIGMAQDFVGSNNCALLEPIGQFGTRRIGGEDAASPRYIYTRLARVARAVFVADDLALAEERREDGQAVEPAFLLPVIPWLLVNGASGIGTGFSTVVPPHDVLEVCSATRAFVCGGAVPELRMRVRNYTGDVAHEAGRYRTCTVLEEESPGVVVVRDLPVGMWTDTYKAHLDGLVAAKRVAGYANESTDTRVYFRAHGVASVDELRAERFVSVRNMHAFDAAQALRRWASAGDILAHFCEMRRPHYARRLSMLVADAETEVAKQRGVLRLISLVTEGDAAFLFSSADVDESLERRGFARVGGSYDHLLGVSIRCCTLQRRDALARALAGTEAELGLLQGRTATDLWLADIARVEAAYAEQG